MRPYGTEGYDKDLLVHKISKQVCRLETFEQEFRGHGSLTVVPEDMRYYRPLEKTNHCSGGQGGDEGGFVFFDRDTSLNRIKEIILHEYCHIVLWRIWKYGKVPEYFTSKALATKKSTYHTFSSKRAEARYYLQDQWAGHKRPFSGLLMSASAEYFDIPWDDQVKLFQLWKRMRVICRDGWGQSWYKNSAYMLDSCIQSYIDIRDGTEETPHKLVELAIDETGINPFKTRSAS
tara:strand:+ start:10306 stop:11004 length:699 start_codon:yes stop_codon:yes gene_type:complete